MNKNKHYHPDTMAVRGGLNRSHFDETAEALYLTSGYVYKTAQEAADSFSGDLDRFVFSRDLIIEESHQRDETMEILPANRISEVTALINRGVSPALIILDSGLSDIKGLAGLTRTLEVTCREVPIAIMGVPTSNSEMRMVLEAGAMGYIPKKYRNKGLFQCLNTND